MKDIDAPDLESDRQPVLAHDANGPMIQDNAESTTAETGGHLGSITKERSVSVIIPFSKPDKIDISIRSVFGQSYPKESLQIIVVGKGTISLTARFPRVAPRDVGPILQPGRARNLGAAHASGEFILFLDDDCEAQPGWIEENLAELHNELVGTVSGVIKANFGGIFETLVDYANFESCRGFKREKDRLWGLMKPNRHLSILAVLS